MAYSTDWKPQKLFLRDKRCSKSKLPWGMEQLKNPCPLCRSNLFYLDGVIQCHSCKFKKEIENGIPLFSKS